MKGKAFKLGIGSVLLLTLLAIAAFLLRSGRSGVAAELSPTPAAFVQQTPSIWESVSLEQIRFGPPRVVLTDTLGLRIVGWISNDEVLILRDTLPGGHGEAIEIFNVRNGTLRRLRDGRIWGKPLWSSKEQALVYLLYNENKKVEELIWHPLEGDARLIGSGVLQPVILAPDGRGAMAYAGGKLVGRVVGPPDKEVQMAFARFAPPASGCGWKYDTTISPDEDWQVVYNCEHFLLVNSEDGTIKELDLGTEIIEGRPFPRWALDAQWSQDGQQLAVVVTFGDFLPRITQLVVLNPWMEKSREIERPPGPLVFSEVDWAPGGRYLIVFGSEATGEGIYSPRMWLVDAVMGNMRDFDLFPFPVALGGDPGWEAAWSPDGNHLLFYCRPQSTLEWELCLASAEVER